MLNCVKSYLLQIYITQIGRCTHTKSLLHSLNYARTRCNRIKYHYFGDGIGCGIKTLYCCPKAFSRWRPSDQFSLTNMFCNYLLNQTLTPSDIVPMSQFLQIWPTKAKATEDGDNLLNSFRYLVMHVSSTFRAGLTFRNLGVKYRGITKYDIFSLQCCNGDFCILRLKDCT